MAEFLKRAPGYINNMNDTMNCQYCKYSKGEDFYEGLNMEFGHRWRNTGIFIAYIVFNIGLVFLGVRFFKGSKR